MALQDYTYSISSDFPETGLDSTRFLHEIQSSEIETSLDRVDTDGDQCKIWFKAALSAADKTILDGDTTGPAGGLIAAHSGEPWETVAVSPVILEPTGSSEKDLQIYGDKFTAALNGATTHDVSFAQERSIQGVSYEIINAGEDDHIRVAIVHSVTFEEIRVMGEGPNGGGIPVPASGSAGVVSEGTAVLPAGVPIRTTYNCAKTSGDQPVIRIQFRTWV